MAERVQELCVRVTLAEDFLRREIDPVCLILVLGEVFCDNQSL